MGYHLSASHVAAIDFTPLVELFDGNFETVSTLLDTASNSIACDVLRIEGGVRADDPAAVADAAHRLKGTSGSIYAQRLSDVSSSIERDARDGSLLHVSALFPELHAAFDSLSAAIASFACGVPPSPHVAEVS